MFTKEYFLTAREGVNFARIHLRHNNIKCTWDTVSKVAKQLRGVPKNTSSFSLTPGNIGISHNKRDKTLSIVPPLYQTKVTDSGVRTALWGFGASQHP